MKIHKVKVFASKDKLSKKNQLAWKIAEIASDNAKLNKDSVDMVINRMIDNASVAIASLNRKAVIRHIPRFRLVSPDLSAKAP